MKLILSKHLRYIYYLCIFGNPETFPIKDETIFTLIILLYFKPFDAKTVYQRIIKPNKQISVS